MSKSKYGWVITKDNLTKEDQKVGIDLPSDKGISGPRNSTYTEAECRKGAKFRMLDDDGEIYYYGYIVGDYSGFEPLDDFGTPNAGCTEIQYKDAQGEWEGL